MAARYGTPPRRQATMNATTTAAVVNIAEPISAPTGDGAKRCSGIARPQNWSGPSWKRSLCA